MTNRLETANHSRSANRAKLAFSALLVLLCLFAQSLVTTALADKRPKDYGRIKVFVPIHDPVKNPDGYPILIDGKDHGNTSTIQRTFQVASGQTHKIEIIFPNDKRWIREVFVNAGRIYCLGAEYSPFTPPVKEVPCPPCSVALESNYRVKHGDPVTINADVNYTGSGDDLTYIWTVSPGSAAVLSGGGPRDRSITLDTTSIPTNTAVRVNLAVDTGFVADKKCSCQGAAADIDFEIPPTPVTFQFVAYDDLKAHLDNLVIDLQQYKDATAYIFYHTGEKCDDALESRLGERTRDYLVNERGFDRNRLVIKDAGKSAIDWMEIYVVPLGGEVPKSNPALEPAARADLKNRCMQDVTTAERQQRRPSRRRR